MSPVHRKEPLHTHRPRFSVCSLTLTEEVHLHAFWRSSGALERSEGSKTILQFIRTILISVCILFIAHAVNADAKDSGKAGVQQGARIFHERCATCHNKQPADDSPFGPPNLYRAFRGQPPLSRTQAETIIENGRNAMPAFGGVLSRTEIASVIAYLRRR